MKINLSKIRYLIYSLFVLFLIWDTAHSCKQFYNATLDGDMSESVVPAPVMGKTMEDPLGIKTVMKKEFHHNPNRFFAHWTFQKTFRILPIALQNFTNPVSSVFATCALTKILMQLSLIVLLCWTITGKMGFFSKDFILLAVLLVPLFQAYGWARDIGMVDISISYAFFYALPTIFLIIYFLPLIFEFLHGKTINIPLPVKLLWLLLAIPVCFSGALNPGIVSIVSFMLITQRIYINYCAVDSGNFFKKMGKAICAIPKNYYFYLLPISILALYSLYVGTYNSAKFWEPMPITELYQRLPQGFWEIITKKSFLYIGLILTINVLLLKLKYKSPKGKKILNIFLWVGIFSLIYILLLPLGGYRSYRPNIIRYDTFMPITLCLFFLFGLSTFLLIKEISNRNKIWYYPIIALTLFVFTKADMGVYDGSCEKNNLAIIANSKDDIICLPNDCPTAAWYPISNPEDSRCHAQMLFIWRITDKPKLFYNSFGTQ